MHHVIRWLVDHATTVLLAAACVMLFGTVAWIQLPRESSPDITIPVIIVTTPYIGVSPEDVENLVSTPMEAEMASLKGIDTLSSTSNEGVSIVVAKFEPDANVADALQRVRDRVNKARPKLPDDVKESTVREISFSDLPVVLITIAGGVDEEQLKLLAEDLQEDITRIPGVLEAKLTGGKDRELQVLVSPERLAHYGLSLRDVNKALDNANVNIPGGKVDLGRGNVLLRVPGEFTHAHEIEQVAIKRVGGKPVFIRDIARVEEGYEARETFSRMGGEASVTLAVTKRAGANILEVAQATKDMAQAHSERWPEGVSFRALGDQSKQIEQSVNDLTNNIIAAMLLVLAVIVVWMGPRPSLFVALSIPLSLMGSMLVLQALGFTLNMVVLFALMLALGMLVDNAIVVVENGYRHSDMGKDPRQAAIDGTAEVAIPIIASTATTVAAFFPLLWWSGIMGEFMGFLPKTIIIVLTMSLIMAVGVLPVAMSRLMPRHQGERVLQEPELREAALSPIMHLYRGALRMSIRWRYLSALSGGLALVGTVILYAFLNHGVEFFPATEPDRVVMGLRLAQGTAVESTDEVVREIESVLAQEPNVDTWVVETGISGSGEPLAGAQAVPSEARITVDFLASANNAEPGEPIRLEPTELTVDRLRERVQQIPGAHVMFKPAKMGPPVGKAIKVEVSGEDYDEVGELAQRLRRDIENIAGTTDLEDNYMVGRPEMRLRVHRGAASRVGVSTAAVGDAVRSAIAGSVPTTVRDGDSETDVRVRLAPEYRQNVQQILDLRLPGREDRSPDTFPVPLSTVASYELVGGAGAVHHIDQNLVVTITGDVLEGFSDNAVRAEVQALLDGYELPTGSELHMTGANKEQEESMAFLSRAFAIACALILLVLVTQFDSVAMPAIIMATVSLSLIGVLWGLLLTGTPFGVIMTGLGVISLAGVVVNNAIVLLDYVQQLESRGLGVGDALVEAGLTRFRPVMLTALTTGLGLMPMALGVSFDFLALKVVIGSNSAKMWGPMAIAMIFGLGFATVLTLVMVPTLYSIYDDLRRLGAKISTKLFPGPASTTAASALCLVFLGGVSTEAQALTLDEAVHSAEQHNLQLQLATEQAIQVGTNRVKAWSALSPRLSGSASYVINNKEIAFDMADALPPQLQPPGGSEPTVIQQKEFWQGDVTVSQRFFSGSALPGLRGAYQMHHAAQEDLRRTRQQLRQQVTASYYGLLTAQKALALREEGLALSEAQRELAARQLEAGLEDRRAMVQAQLAVSQAKRDLQGAHAALVDAETTFELTTGVPGEALSLPAMPAVPTDLQVALRDALTDRPDLHAADYRTQAMRNQRTGTALTWLPVIDGVASYNYSQNTGFNNQSWNWRVVLQGTWTLWDGGLRVAQQQEAASQYRAAQLQRELIEQQARREVRVAWERFQQASQGYSAMETEQALASENLLLAERAFTAGSTSWLELQGAKLQHQATELAALQERMSRDLAALALLTAVGGA